jgi:membrane fusion protein, copper/silver efflux system
MRRTESRWLALGVLIGAIAAVGVYRYFDTVGAVYDRPGAHRAPLQSEPLQPEPPVDVVSQSTEPLAVQLTEHERRSIGIETVEVQRRTIQKEIAAPGKVAEPETGIGAISARIGGRIDKLFIKVTGETVSRGQPVATIYSPEVFTAGEEYKLALENRQRLSASREPQALADADELIRASRRRLELWGLNSEQIEEIASAPERPIQITIYAGMSGVVAKRNVSEGQYIKEGDVLLELIDLSAVWVEASIFESDIPLVRNGQAVKITAPALNGSVRGTINFLQPSVDPQTRTMSVRIQVPNPQMRLRPGMFVQVSFETPLAANAVAVPRSAVLDTGKEKIVYVEMENGVYEKRAIETSASADEYYAVTRGVEAGERVVTHGNFLLDSQTRLTGSVTGMFGGSKAFTAEGTPAAPQAAYSINLRSEPSPPKGGDDGTFHVTVTGPDGKPVTDAQVQVTLLMPAMPAMGMGEMRSSVNLAWNGSEYTGTGTIAMAGPWNVTVEARRGGQLLGVYRSRLDAK